MQNDDMTSEIQTLCFSFSVQSDIWRSIVSTLTFCILHSAFCLSAGAAPPEASLDQIAAGMNRFALDNGLIVLAREDASAPVVSIQVWVGAGAVHEQEFLGGGLSHLIEHMIFKGTPKRPPGEISRSINDLGGSINAYTSLDRTVFLVDLPSAHWSKGLAVLADAVMNASFPEDEWRREKDVILREMAMGKDNPERQISELLCQTAYTVHPYRVPVIGYEDIFKTLTRADLLTFFRRHYMPNNMIVAIVGNVRFDNVRAEVKKQFGDYPRRAYPPIVLPSEPEQVGARTARQAGAWTVARLEWAWHTVPLSHPDAPALDLLAAIAGQGRSSRLGIAIKENKKLVSQVDAWSFTPREAGLFGISAVFDPTNEPALTQALEEEITRFSTMPFSPDEIEKARRQMLTGTLTAFQTMHGQADQFASGEFYAGTPSFFQVYLRRLRAVTPASLADVVHRYLTPDNLTEAVLLPGGSTLSVEREASSGGQTKEGSTSNTECRSQNTLSAQRSTLYAPDAPRSTLPGCDAPHSTLNAQRLASGLVLLTHADHKLPFVDFRVVCGGGLLFENESNNGISSLVAELLTRGTKRRSAQDIAGMVESRGGSLSAFAGQNSFGLQARCLKDDAGDFMDLLADCLLNPAFAADEVAKQKTVQLAAIKQQRESPMFLAQEALRQVLFPGHPYRFSPEGTSASVQALSGQALRDYHAKTVVSGNTVLAIFGDITPNDAGTLTERFLGRFPAGQATPKRFAQARERPALEHRAAQPTLPRQIVQKVPKEQTIILAGFPGIELKDPRRDALDILQKAMNGLSSDLMTRIRDEQGLVYYTGVLQRPGLEPGFLALYAGTHTGALDRVQGLMQEEVRRVTTQGLRAEEFERARAQLIADHQQRLQLNGEIAFECALNELYGLGYGHSFTLEKRLQALTPEDVRKAAATLLTPEKTARIIIMPEAK